MPKKKDEQASKKQDVFMITLTKMELVHLRDLFSIVLPPDAKRTVSQALAEVENRTMNESMLWSKISDACVMANLPVGDAAPDYVVSASAAPPLSVFQLASEPEAVESPSVDLFAAADVASAEDD